MKRLSLFFLFLCAIAVKGFTQSEYRSGYIITNSNDTVYGLIDYRGSILNSEVCSFKENDNSEPIKYSPTSIKAYRFIDSKFFISKRVTTGEIQKDFFLEYLVNGIVDIYCYRDMDGDHYLVEDEEGNLMDLKNDKKIVEIGDTKYLKESRQYVGVLRYAFKKSPTLNKKVENVDLSNKSLIKIAKEYHQEICSDQECIVYEKNVPKLKLEFGPVVGLNISGLNNAGNTPVYYQDVANDVTNNPVTNYYYFEGNFTKSFSPNLGVFLKLNFPQLSERIFLLYECSMKNQTNKKKDSGTISDFEGSFSNDMEIKFHSLRNSLNLQYEFPKKNKIYTFHIGGFYDYIYKIDYHRTIIFTNSYNETHIIQKTTDTFLKKDIGYSFGVGVGYPFFGKHTVFTDLKFWQGFGLHTSLHDYGVSLNFSVPIF